MDLDMAVGDCVAALSALMRLNGWEAAAEVADMRGMELQALETTAEAVADIAASMCEHLPAEQLKAWSETVAKGLGTDEEVAARTIAVALCGPLLHRCSADVRQKMLVALLVADEAEDCCMECATFGALRSVMLLRLEEL